MARKLRFFKDQVSKAGLISSARPDLQPDIELEELEVRFYIIALCYSQKNFIIIIIRWLQFCGLKKKGCYSFGKKGKRNYLMEGQLCSESYDVHFSYFRCNFLSMNMSYWKWTLIVRNYGKHIMSSWSSRWYCKRYLFFFLFLLLLPLLLLLLREGKKGGKILWLLTPIFSSHEYCSE